MKFKHMILLPVLAVVISGCQTTGWDGPSAVPLSQWTKALPRDPLALGPKGAEGMVKNSRDLTDQKRFLEARNQLAALRDHQAPQSEGFSSLTAAMASLSLQSGDVAGFRRLARQLENGWEHEVRVDPGIVEIVAIYRFLEGRALPVNTPEPLRRYLKSLPQPAAKTARVR